MHRSGGNDLDVNERQNLSYRFAAEVDLIRFYGSLPKMTVKAVVVHLAGEPVGVIGLAMGLDCATFYSDAKPELDLSKKPMAVLRAIKIAMKMVESCDRTVYAISQEGTDIVKRLGFEHLEGEVYQWRGSRQLSHT